MSSPSEKDLLMIPGPTNVDPEVLRALSRPTLSHVSERFAELLRETIKDLGVIFQTNGLILPLAGSGTLGAEVALANIIEPGNKVLVISNGYFADRLGDIAGTLGAVVDKYEISWGSAANPSNLEGKLRANRYKASFNRPILGRHPTENSFKRERRRLPKQHQRKPPTCSPTATSALS